VLISTTDASTSAQVLATTRTLLEPFILRVHLEQPTANLAQPIVSYVDPDKTDKSESGVTRLTVKLRGRALAFDGAAGAHSLPAPAATLPSFTAPSNDC